MNYHGVRIPTKGQVLANRLIIATGMLCSYALCMYWLFEGK